MFACTRRIVVFLLAAILVVPAHCGEKKGTVNLDGSNPTDLMYGIIMSSFNSRKFDNIEEIIEDTFEEVGKGDIVRIRLAMALAKLGKPQAEKALGYLKGWAGDYSGSDEALRLASMGELNLYYLDRPGDAIGCFEKVLRDHPAFAGSMFAFLFNIYTGTREFLDPEKARACLYRPEKGKKDIRAIFNEAVYRAMIGDAEARDATTYYTSQIPAKRVALKLILAPAWGWLGDVDQVVDCLEAGLTEEAINYAPAGFRLYCDWMRQSPAYDSVREDDKFIALWERLYQYEPEARGTNIMLQMPE